MTPKEAIDHLICGRINCLNNADEDEKLRNLCIHALEKADKYRWHDLRKNPDDLPAVEERVVLTLDIILTLDLMRKHRNVYGYRAKNGAWVVNGFETSMEVIAWRIDEPFEEDNE